MIVHLRLPIFDWQSDQLVDRATGDVLFNWQSTIDNRQLP